MSQGIPQETGSVDGITKLQECLLDCGKAIIANNAKIELLTDKVCSAVTEVAAAAVTDMRAKLDEMVNCAEAAVRKTTADMNDAVSNMLDQHSSNIKQGMSRLEAQSQKQAEDYANHLEMMRVALEEELMRFEQQRQAQENLFKDHLDQTQTALADHADTLSKSSDRLRSELTKANTCIEESINALRREAMALGTLNRKMLLVLVAMSALNAALGAGLIYLVLAR